METHFDSGGFLAVMVFILAIAFVLALIKYVYEMASDRGRNTFYWIIFSFAFTPVLSILLLYCIGETEDRRKERLLSDKEYKKYFED